MKNNNNLDEMIYLREEDKINNFFEESFEEIVETKVSKKIICVRWLNSFQITRELKESIWWELSHTGREKSAEFLAEHFEDELEKDFINFALSKSEIYKNKKNRIKIGIIYNESDIKEIFALDVYSERFDTYFLRPTQNLESRINFDLSSKDSIEEKIKNYRNSIGFYNPNNEVILQERNRPRGFIVFDKEGEEALKYAFSRCGTPEVPVFYMY